MNSKSTTLRAKQDSVSSLFSVTVIVVLLLNFPTVSYCFKSQQERLPAAVDQEQYYIDACPPWYMYVQDENSGCFCKFDGNLKGIVYVSHPSRCLKENTSMSSSLLLQIGFCMTFDSDHNKTLLVNCPYDTVRDHELLNFYVVVNSSVSNLNDFTCGPLNREEENCHKCIDNFGPSPYTLDLSCFNCTVGYYRGWMLYFTLEFIPLTVFFIVITVLRLRPSQGYLNSFILFSQLIVAAFTFSSQVPFIYSMGKMSLVLVRILQTLYGFWNLDFFRYAIPGFCVSSKLRNLDVLSLQLLSVFYPMTLILVAWVTIHLYEKNFKLFVWVWRPFRRCLSHFSVTNNPKRAVVNLFTMFLLLSYSKLLFVAANLINTVGVYRFNPSSHSTKPFSHDHGREASLFLDPSMRYFSPEHARYVVLSVFLFVAFILPPPIILLLYPTKLFQTFINNCCPNSRTIRMFAHSCHGCFKNGLNGTRDCRHFAGVYLLLRIALFLCKTAIINPVAQWIMVAFCFAVATFMIGMYRPYKNPYLSALDFVFMVCFAIAALFSAFVTTNNPTKHDNSNKLVSVVFGFIFLSALLPLVYISCLVIYHCKRKFKKVKHFLISRRRDYLDISDFQYDPDQENSDNIMEQGQTASILRSRVLNSDSFQSE